MSDDDNNNAYCVYLQISVIIATIFLLIGVEIAERKQKKIRDQKLGDFHQTERRSAPIPDENDSSLPPEEIEPSLTQGDKDFCRISTGNEAQITEDPKNQSVNLLEGSISD